MDIYDTSSGYPMLHLINARTDLQT